MEHIKIEEAEKIQMDTAFSELRKNFASNETRSYQWRKDTLLHLRKVLKELENEISQALYSDLKLGAMPAYVTGVGVCVSLLDHAISNLADW